MRMNGVSRVVTGDKQMGSRRTQNSENQEEFA